MDCLSETLLWLEFWEGNGIFEVRGAAPSTSTVGCNNNIEGAHYVLPPFPLQANGVDAFEELKKMAIDGEGASG